MLGLAVPLGIFFSFAAFFLAELLDRFCAGERPIWRRGLLLGRADGELLRLCSCLVGADERPIQFRGLLTGHEYRFKAFR